MNYGKKIEQVRTVNGFAAAVIIQKLLSSGRICRVDYLKKDGQKTTMICRTGVHAYASGTGRRVTNLESAIIGVWSFDRGGYRTLKADNISTIKSGSVLYKFPTNLTLGTTFTDYKPELNGKRTLGAITSPIYGSK